MKKKTYQWMISFIVGLLIVSSLLPAWNSLTVLAEEDSADHTDDEEMIDIIVEYEKDIPSEEELDPSYENVHTMENLLMQTMTVPLSEVTKISQKPGVYRITEDQEMELQRSDYHPDHVTADDWNLEAIRTFDAWNENFTGSGVNIAVLDTGFYQHHDLSFAGGHSIFDGEYEDLPADEWTNDHDGHGTHVAGIIGAGPDSPHSGVAYGANLFGVKVYHQEEDTGRAKYILAGIEWAIENGMDIITISSGFRDPVPSVEQAATQATNNGILVFAANGNSTDPSRELDYPARYGNVIGVANVAPSAESWARHHDSISGPETELSAPGTSIVSTSNDGGYVADTGTSMATPHAAGVAALLMQQNPGMTAGEIRYLMHQNALDIGPEGFDPDTGHGLVRYSVPETDDEDEPDDSEDPTDSEDEDEDADADSEDEDEENDEEPAASDSDNENGAEDETPPTTEPDETESETDESDTPNNSDDNGDSEDEDEEQEDEEDSEDDGDADTSSSVWVRPTNNNGVANINDGDLESVADGGTLVLSFDASLEHISSASFSADEIAEIRERNITLLIARPNIEWSIPSENFEEGDATLQFELSPEELDFSDQAVSDIYRFAFIQNGNERTEFPEDMTYRFFVDEPEANGALLYEWAAVENEWTEFGSEYGNDSVRGSAPYTATLGVFTPEAFHVSADAETDTDVIDSERVEAAIEDTETNESEEENSRLLAYSIGGIALITLSLGSGFYYFGKKDSNN